MSLLHIKLSRHFIIQRNVAGHVQNPMKEEEEEKERNMTGAVDRDLVAAGAVAEIKGRGAEVEAVIVIEETETSLLMTSKIAK